MGRRSQYNMHLAYTKIIENYDLVLDFQKEIHISAEMNEFYKNDWELLATHKVYKNKNCKIK
jgi:hypothetical protein